ncbi:HEAT repeat domain-containing protein [Cytophagaceae bacterium YF14B1]|uniref:HEAT repeat domain-containing protein n=1 Tax=Xanthocytophaga flava TaxID=3048013 RepID=A0AAE3UBY9_9BACT|nr:HEAT repeat domain-containing protein [Xanthocytophaga flavus]MDJ1486257.1 HEAT repeat domain-containing protein [Xanthocytophaga flavus]
MTAFKKHFYLPVTLLLVSCLKPLSTDVITIDAQTGKQKAKQIKETSSIQLAEGLKIDLWASDTLSPDPVSLEIDHLGRAYITRTIRQKNSEFDIRGHRDWMTPSISFQTVEDRRAFLRKTFAPENSQQNTWLKDLNEDGSHDWKDLTVEKDEIWRVEDKDGDGIAETATKVFVGPSEEVTDVGGGVLVREKDAFWCSGPDMWRLEDKNSDGVYETKQSISHGYAVHIGFGGHGMSGAIQGPDGKIYWQIGDIGANITDKSGQKHEYPNEGILVRSNPDGSDFEVVAHGIRNDHEFVFDALGNIISSDNDGDHPGESERLVHIVEGGDSGWRSNWQYGKYTDPRNNNYNVWMKEKLYTPRWEGQAAYILPPIQNFHNGPTGMVFNPGTALGKEWTNKFFLVEFVGTPTGSHIWSFGLKPKGASFVLDGDKKLTTGILPTGIRFGTDGALYAADWVTGWDTKNYGRIWKIDVDKNKNDLESERKETKRLMALNYTKQSESQLISLLSYADMRIRQKAQFELVARGAKGLEIFKKLIHQKDNQFARIHAIWGIGQLSQKDRETASILSDLLKDTDQEIIAQAAKVIGDVRYQGANQTLISLVNHSNPRVKFFATQALGRVKDKNAVSAILKMIEQNNDEDVYLRHVGVLALSRIGDVESVINLKSNSSKALRLAAVLILRKWRNPEIASFLKEDDEYLVTEVSRAINDDLSIADALPALAQMVQQTKFTYEPLLRRAINACLRVGGEKELDMLIAFAGRTDVSDDLRAEALSVIGTWANPSVLDRVDGRYRGELKRNATMVTTKIKDKMGDFLKSSNPTILVSSIKLLSELNISAYNTQLVSLLKESDKPEVRAASIIALADLNYAGIEQVIKLGMEDKEGAVRTSAISLLTKLKTNKENLPSIVNPIFEKGSFREQQQMLKVLGEMPVDNTRVVFEDLIHRMVTEKLSANVKLDLIESVEGTKDENLIQKLEPLKGKGSETEQFKEALLGGDSRQGRNIFLYNSAAQCIRCHSIGGEGGSVGPNLQGIGKTLSREQILQAMIEPSARIAPGYGNIALTMTDGQEVTGVLMKESEEELILKTSAAEPLKVPVSRIKNRENYPSGMPPMGTILSKREIRDLVEFLSNMKSN